MAIDTEREWRAAGAPWHKALPIEQIHNELIVVHGKTAVAQHVGTLGDPDHLNARPPEDHTPYSATGWPIPAEYPYVYALDDDLPGFARQFEYWIALKRGRRATWVKYINLQGWHYSWMPRYAKRSSSDSKKHGHLSIRSDWTHRSIAYGWRTIERGAEGPATVTLQTMLRWQGFTLDDDGAFGPVTDKAVRAFQSRRGLVVDGKAGPRTRTALVVLG